MTPELFPSDVQRVVNRLAALGLQDRRSIWKRFKDDEWTSQTLLGDLNRNVQPGDEEITRAQLAAAVAELVRLDVDQLAKPRWPIRVVQFTFIAVVMALLSPNGPLVRKPTPPQILAARDIPPYHILVDGDIKIVPAAADQAAESQRRALYGRYTTRFIRRESPFSADAHADSAKIPDLSRRRVATLRVIPPDASLSGGLPAHVTLTAPAQTGSAACTDAWLLAVSRDAGSATGLATVALPEACSAESLNALLAARAIALVWEPRP